MNSARIGSGLWIAIAIALCSVNAQAQHRKSLDVDKAGVIAHWTKERRANAIPRDLVIDPRGLGYLRQPDGSLRPYGHDISAQVGPTNQAVSPFGKPVADPGDITPPSITDMDPSPGETIGSTYTFKATVTDDLSGIRSVTFNIVKEGSTFVNSFSATKDSGDVWSVGPLYPSDGSWTWWVEAKDGAGKGGNSGTSSSVKFTVSSGDANNNTNTNQDVITNDQWSGGAVQTAAGRLYFEMPSNSKRKGPWTGYVCSGTVATDNTITIDDTTSKQTVNDHGRSVIITAAHCVYDDVNKAFARNVMFIPNQAGTSGTRTDRDCSNDPLGCWVPSFGVVDVEWTKWTFPDNMKWDYAYYVVSDDGAHSIATTGDPASGSSALDSVAGSLPVSFVPPLHDRNNDRTDFAFALGYSYSDDPKFMYCAEDMTTKAYNNQTVNWWLPGCGLSGGSSGGPWVQKTNDPTTWDGNRGDGVNIISVNSWGYTSSPGMAGPMLAPLPLTPPTTSSASCIFDSAKSTSFESVASTDGDAGKVVTCP